LWHFGAESAGGKLVELPACFKWPRSVGPPQTVAGAASGAGGFCLFKEVQGDRKTDEPQSGAHNAAEKDKFI